MKKSKVLCLHGGTSSAAHFKEQLQIWPSNVLEEMDLVFLDGPFLIDNIKVPTFRWYDTQDATKLDSTFNQSIAYIEETMAKLGPFDGVLGFSQGACIAAALPGMQAQH
ncbi:esterase FUS5 [Heracleum sosnowskyi]|uniref:Esterase FUS5 n=1 Tax=Heracleum sosnowskyi TaxID=360622 RepID=A0AAD8IKP6_9APIA|nr:esterase FUS5 [Heracleum sosnowskyi]